MRTLRGPNCDSDRFLVRTIIRQRLIITPRRSSGNWEKWNLDNIRDQIKLKQYRKTIYEKLLQKKEQKDVNHEWKNVKSIIMESAEETIKTRGKHPRNEWWDEECRQAILKKNISRKKCLQKITRINQEQYSQAGKEANKTFKEKKKRLLNNRIKQIGETHKQNETRKFFKDIRT